MLVKYSLFKKITFHTDLPDTCDADPLMILPSLKFIL